MFHTISKILGLALAILGLASTLAVAVEMTCTQHEETPLTLIRGAYTVRKTCTMAKGPDGKEVKVRVSDRRTGERLRCLEKQGETGCREVPYAFTAPVTGVTQ